MNDVNLKANDPMIKKSLLNSLRILENRANSFSELARYSDELVNKFENPRPSPNKPSSELEAKNVEIVDVNLIDLFDMVSERLQAYIDRIGNNCDKINSFIE